MRIALGQLHIVWLDREATARRAEKLIREAAEARCDLIVFPELSLTGFSTDVGQISESRQNAPGLCKMQEYARKYQIAIGFGWAALAHTSDKKADNVFSLIDARGETLAEYAKLHPFTYGGEAECFEKGNEIVTVPFLGRTIGLFICYDLRFPEIFQIAARKADIMIVIANWPQLRSAHWTTLLRARAIETQSYVAGVNCVGEIGGDVYSGDSMAVDSLGNILGQISGREGILVCDLDDRAWHLREKFATAADRRERFYCEYFR